MVNSQQWLNKKYPNKKETKEIWYTSEEKMYGNLIITDFPELKSINIYGFYKEIEKNNEIPKLEVRNCSKLTNITYVATNITNDAVVKNCPLLWSLSLDRNRINNLIIENCPAIVKLDLENNLFFPNVCQLPNLEKLKLFKLKENIKKISSLGNKYNLQDFKNWLNADETRKRGIKDWEKIFASFEKEKLWRTNFMKERGCRNVDFDKLNDLDFFSNYIFCYNGYNGECEISNPHYAVLLQWLEERDTVRVTNAQEWLDKEYPKEERKNKTELRLRPAEQLEGKLDLNEFINLERLYIGRQKISELDTENCRKLVIIDIDKMNGDEEIKWNNNLYSRAKQTDKLEKEKSELEGILEKFAKRNEDLEQEKQELSKQLAEMKLKEKMEVRVEVDTNKY